MKTVNHSRESMEELREVSREDKEQFKKHYEQINRSFEKLLSIQCKQQTVVVVPPSKMNNGT